MEGKEPIPISKGVEIKAEKVKEIKEWAIARHAEITRLGAIVEEVIAHPFASGVHAR